LTERFEEFAILMGYLLGRPGVAVVPRNVTTTLPNPRRLSLKREVNAAEAEQLAEVLADDIWFYESAVKEYERRIADPRVQQLFATAIPLFRSHLRSVQELVKLTDPGNPKRGAFDSVRAPLYSDERD
jgi:hypothetical protein